MRQYCEHCHEEFSPRIADTKRNRARFCSISCSNRNRKQKKPPNVVCAYCNKRFYRNNSKKQNSKSGLFFCCRKHKDLAQRLGGIKEIQPDHYGDGPHAKYRNAALRQLPHRCNRCGYDQYVEILQVHHRDSNRDNNDISNLEILCPNCHAIEHRIKNLEGTAKVANVV